MSAARVAYLIHSAAGLWFAVLLTIVMCTGTIAVIAPQIDQMLFPELRAVPPTPDAEKLNVGTLYDNVAKAYPGMGITQIEAAAHDRYAVATTTVLLPDNKTRTITMDPYTGDILGEKPHMTVQGIVLPMHAVLFQGVYGLYVVNFCGVLLLAGIISGLVVYRRFWKGFFKRPRFGRSMRIVLGDLHRLAALWTLPFLLVITITGCWYFYNLPLVHLGLAPDIAGPQHSPPMLAAKDLDSLGPETPMRISGAQSVDIVRAIHPDMTITGLIPPRNLNMPFVVYGDRGEYLHGHNPNAVYVHPFTGEIMDQFLSGEQRLDQYIFLTMSQLHHGELVPHSWGYAAQMTMKGVWFLCGAGACFLSVSGLLIYFRRTRKAAHEFGWKRVWHWVKPWGGPMGVFKYVNVLIVVGLAIGFSQGPPSARYRPPEAKVAFSSMNTGPFEISAMVASGPRGGTGSNPIQPGARIQVFPRIAGGHFDEARTILVGLTGADGETKAKKRASRVKGAEKLAFATVRLPKDLDGVALWMEVRKWDGTAHRVQWPLASATPLNPS